MLKLVIIESPSKSQALKKYLGNGYEVFATKGHIRDLPTKSLGLDVRNNFEPNYIVVPDKKQLIAELQSKASRADDVLIATDPDREGEAISWHVASVLGYPKDRKCRITFNEISKNAVTKALQAPREIDERLVDAQQARRVLDRIVGYKLSPIICRKIAPKISAGRVQSVALKLVVDREREIEAFVPEEYWTVSADFEKDKTKFRATLTTKNKKKYLPKTKAEVDALIDHLGSEFLVSEVKKSVTKQHALPPFTTSTMQQDAGNKLGMSLSRTTAAAQALYEGVEVKGEGKIALVTYIRTDSVRISSEAQSACREYIGRVYGKEFVPEKPNIYHTKESAQDAHEAIRPISMEMTPERVKETLTPDHYKLYKLIYERFLASQMSEAQYASVSVGLSAKEYGFRVSGRTMLFPGFTAVYKEFVEDENAEGMAGRLPILEEGQVLQSTKVSGEQKFTKPPLRYTEARLVKAMEEKGIGRPATYTPTINVLTSRKYASKEGKELVPTQLGMKITDYLDQFFSSVINVKFTAHMEKRLDDIVTTGEDWHEVVSSFWDGFRGLLEKADSSAVSMKEPPKETDIVCPKCGGKMVIREGRYGKFLGCSNFPKCHNIMQMEEDKKPVGKCPQCGKNVVPRKSKTGKTFFSCEGYPDCNFMSWDIPTGEKCPKCDGYLVRKGKQIRCSNKSCDYKG